MRVVVTGATGNLGSSVLRALDGDDRFDQIIGVARRTPDWRTPKITWAPADITQNGLRDVLARADALVHLAWLIQPSRDVGHLWDVNAQGSHRLLADAAASGVGTIVHLSSVGAYSPRSSAGAAVDESWPTDGVGTSSYSRAKAYVERCLDALDHQYPGTRVVRLRPALIFKREAGDRVRRLFLGALFPGALLAPDRLPIVPAVRDLTFQAVHADDVAAAVKASLLRPVTGPFNLAADPVLRLDDVARILGARTLVMPKELLRALVGASWAARLHPADVGWFDLALSAPTLDVGRARTELAWDPVTDARDALAELIAGIRDRTGGRTEPLSSQHPQLQELRSRQGAVEARP